MVGKSGKKWHKVGTMDEVIQHSGEGLSRQNLFCNVYTHKLDAKRRMTIPSDWRALVGEPQRIFVLQGVDTPHLRALPAHEMARRLEKLKAVSLADTSAQDHIRALTARSDLLPWDAQGRIRVREELLAFAGIKDDAVLVGSFNGFEIWSPEKWNEKQKAAQQATLADAIRFFGL